MIRYTCIPVCVYKPSRETTCVLLPLRVRANRAEMDRGV